MNKKKKILLICDDLRSFSGVGSIAREIILHTAYHFDWTQIAGSLKHHEAGKIIDISESVNKEVNITDAYVRLYPVDGYGTPSIIRQIIELEKPDAMMLFTDPRSFQHIFDMESEIRKKMPIIYLNIWDSLPAPHFNSPFYESIDLLMGISQQTVQINKMVLDSANVSWIDLDNKIEKIIKNSQRTQPVLLTFVPHGKDANVFYPIQQDDPSYQQYVDYRKNIIGDDFNFVMFFNSRNMRRKQIPDSLLAYKLFLDSIPYEKALKCKFILHTEIVSEHGTDLDAVVEYLFGEKYENNVLLYQKGLDTKELNFLYNIADCTILLTSNEGWGLALTESILSGTPIIANCQGGMQSQMRFTDENGKWYTPSYEVPSNHRGTYKNHGEWAFPVYPTNLSMQGSPITPYIFDDRCSFEDAAIQIGEVYKLSREERKQKGLKGREWALSDEAGFNSIHQAKRVIKAIDTLLETWKPRETFEIINTNEYKGKYINHPIIF